MKRGYNEVDRQDWCRVEEWRGSLDLEVAARRVARLLAELGEALPEAPSDQIR
jgi:hypothetical protein